MSTELNRRDHEPGTPASLEDFKSRPSPHFAVPPVRLSPLPARNMLLTILFFSALAAAMLYWIFFPPAPQQTSANSSGVQAVERP